jgi:hypothetical protein
MKKKTIKTKTKKIPSPTIESLRKQGCCVVIFTLAELQGADPKSVEESLIEHGWEVINCLK